MRSKGRCKTNEWANDADVNDSVEKNRRVGESSPQKRWVFERIWVDRRRLRDWRGTRVEWCGLTKGESIWRGVVAVMGR